ncbi:PmoA family protein [Bauldia sp.]|uniref:DUF6807 domain-containing protein n=1 Tax=Bauldia sp. TaxID=2575872 RepID=UPI003BAC90BD
MPDTCHWTYRPGHNVSLLRGDRVLATYSFANKDGAKPFVHPLTTVQGVPLTAFQPSDHVWHRGIWFAWKYINGVNYWEEDPVEVDGETRSLSEGRTLVQDDETVTFSSGCAEVATWLDYVNPEGLTVMRERRLVRICPPQSYGDFVIDWEQDFTVGDKAVSLSATPVAAETPWGGYAGFGYRAGRNLRDFRVLTSEGATGAEANGAQARWVDISGVADGSKDIAAGIAILDHPDNPRHPPPSYVFFDTAQFGYINPSLVRDEPLDLPAAAKLNLKYRVVVHDGWPDSAALERDYQAFASTQ